MLRPTITGVVSRPAATLDYGNAIELRNAGRYPLSSDQADAVGDEDYWSALCIPS